MLEVVLVNELVSNKKTASLLLVAFLVVILAAIYFYFINPLLAEKSLIETSLSSVESEVAILESGLASANSEKEEERDIDTLHSKVPLERELEKILLLLESVKATSDATVQTITFNNYDSVVAETELVTSGTSEEESAPTDEESGDDVPVSPVANLSLPYELKLLTFNVNILTKDYNSLLLFINEMESVERVIKVDQITLSTSEEGLASSVQITTFFYDGE